MTLHCLPSTDITELPATVSNSTENPETQTTAPAEKSAWKTLSGLLPFMAPYRGRVILAGSALLVAAAATLTIPTAFRFLIDRGFSLPANVATDASASATAMADSGIAAGQVNSVFLGLFAVALILALATALRYYCVSWLGDRITADLRQAVYSQVLRQDPVFFETLRTGEVQSRLSSDTTLIQSLIGSSISLGLRNSLLFVGALGLMIWTSPHLASIIVGLLVLVVVPIMVFGRRVRKLSKDSQDKLADTGALANETLNAMSTVQSYVRENMESDRYSQATNAAFDSAIRRNRNRSYLTALAITLIFGIIVFVLWLGAQAVIDGRMSPGLLTQFMLYAALVAGSTGALAEVLGDVQRAAGATERLLELLHAQPAIASGKQSLVASSTADVAGLGARVDFNNVNFSYPSRPGEQALEELSFTIEPGQTVALVGPSGAGKTTVLQLLLRFYDPRSGSISLDNSAIDSLKLNELREAIGFVSQDSVVFSDDVYANLRYGKPDATDEEVRQAASDAQALDFIERLPDGFNTYLGEKGVRLSGGQRQRLSIARALLKNPPLLLLDEATSALDAESERKVQMALERAMSGRTTLVIAHRLATIVNADRILVMDEGRIIESGNHQELLAGNGLYAKLASMQFNAAEFHPAVEAVRVANSPC
ncbi:ABC transporter transmembrane domain-containing protein [Granulosicoccus antarcticus]|uniref:Multidrug resistance ABC transporter ATP-binding/permease protein BmrA n=1 Tax=Granulosicoccus antarcticus IMCC3135 TaxID=1192854 RepID=A0A2Z2P5T3_9GAMM|nr:ABC transporter transmembrane domain-containing protein [Granulosicoccus antarcticus]ASJ76880.1 Multidrug resistance ABC transporter ATP-binding/permease protein BmrA [Granulosicoccus antarcticus IMCC3135]